MTLRSLCQLVATIAFGVLCADVNAADWPAKPLTLIVPFAAGGPTDVLARAVAEKMARDLGQPIVVENAPGAGGTVGSARVARARGDGYTLLVGNVGTLAASATLYKKLNYDVLTAFTPIASIGDAPQVVSARKDFPASGLDEFAAYVKQNMEKMNCGAAGVGSGSFLGAALLNAQLGVAVKTINYRGAGPALNDVIAGHIDYLVDSTTTSVSHIKAGTVKGIVVLRPQRIKALPDVPAAGESSFPKLHYDIWNMLLVPAETPKAIVTRLNQAARAAMRDVELISRLSASGIETPAEHYQTVEGATELLRREVALWRPLLTSLSLSLD